MSDLRDLYQELIVDHSRKPRNFRKIDPASRIGEGFNPLCGDRVTVYLTLEGDKIRDASFQGAGCAISTSSASIMTEVLKGKTLVEAEALFGVFHDLVTGKSTADIDSLGKLAVFAGVSEFPARVKCASLAWHTVHNALAKPAPEVANTEAGDPTGTDPGLGEI